MIASSQSNSPRFDLDETFRNPEKRDYLSRKIVKAKPDSKINLLKSTNKPELSKGISHIQSLRNQIENSVPISNENQNSAKEHKN
jgi:hypothetical protein